MDRDDGLKHTYQSRHAYTFHISWRCIRCGTIAHDFFDGLFRRVGSRKYVWPDGYRYSKDELPTREHFYKLMLGIGGRKAA